MPKSKLLISPWLLFSTPSAVFRVSGEQQTLLSFCCMTAVSSNDRTKPPRLCEVEVPQLICCAKHCRVKLPSLKENVIRHLALFGRLLLITVAMNKRCGRINVKKALAARTNMERRVKGSSPQLCPVYWRKKMQL